jgi:hypothetical protein
MVLIFTVYLSSVAVFCNVIIHCLAGGNFTGGPILEDDGEGRNPQ